MKIHELKTRTITLDVADIKQAIILYLRERGEKEIDETHILINPENVGATVTLTEETKEK